MCGECINPWGNLEYDNFSPFQVNANKCLLCSFNGMVKNADVKSIVEKYSCLSPILFNSC